MDSVIILISILFICAIVSKIAYEIVLRDGYVKGFEELNDIWMDGEK